jgi:hypothetical protein
MKSPYLTAYCVAQLVAWATVFCLVVQPLVTGEAAAAILMFGLSVGALCVAFGGDL